MTADWRLKKLPVESSLVGWWKLDETSGTVAADSSGNGNDGAISGGVTLGVAGKLGTAADFDGVDGAISVGDIPVLDAGVGSFALTAWVTMDAGITGIRTVAGKKKFNRGLDDAGYILDVESGVPTVFVSDGLGSGVTVTGSDIRGTGLRRLSLICDRANNLVKLRADGVTVDSASIAGQGSFDNAEPFTIGVRGDLAGNHYNGVIDEVRRYDRELSDAEDTEEYDATKDGVRPEHDDEAPLDGAEEDLVDVTLVDAFNRFARRATVLIDDPDGTKRATYEKFLPIRLSVRKGGAAQYKDRFGGFVASSKSSEGVARIELLSHDLWLRRRSIVTRLTVADTIDASGNGHDLTATGDPATRDAPTARFGKGFDLDAVDDRFTLADPSLFRITGELSIVSAFELDDVATEQFLIGCLGDAHAVVKDPNDATAGNRDLTVVGTPGLRAQDPAFVKYGAGYDLNPATPDYLKSTNAAFALSQLAAVMAFDLDALPASGTISGLFARGDPSFGAPMYSLHILDDGRLRHQMWHSSFGTLETTSTNTIGTGFHRLTYRYTSSQLLVKVDGVTFIDVNPISSEDAGGSPFLSIGWVDPAFADAGGLDGAVREFRIWDTLVAQSLLDDWADESSIGGWGVLHTGDDEELAAWFMQDDAATASERTLYELKLRSDGKIQYRHHMPRGYELIKTGSTALATGEHTLSLRRHETGAGGIDVKVDGATEIALAPVASGQRPAGGAAADFGIAGRPDGTLLQDGGTYEVRLWAAAIAQATLDQVIDPADDTFEHKLEGSELAAWTYDSITKTELLKQIIETYTPLTWNPAKVSVTDDTPLTRVWRGVDLGDVITDIAASSADEEFGADDAQEFFFRPQATNPSPRDFTEGEYVDTDFQDDSRSEVNRVVIYYGPPGSEAALAVNDTPAQEALQTKFGAPRPVVIEYSAFYPDIKNAEDAEAKARAILAKRSQIQTGRIRTWDYYDGRPGDEATVTDTDRGVNGLFRVAEIQYGWVADETLVKVAENEEGVVDILVGLSDEVRRVDLRSANFEVDVTEVEA